MSDDRRLQMEKEGFEVAYIKFDRGMDEVISVAYRYVGVVEEEGHAAARHLSMRSHLLKSCPSERP